MPKKKLARIISEIFNGFTTMLLAPSLVFVVSDIPTIYKIIFPTLYISVPLTTFFILKKLGKVSDYEFTKREERPLFFTIVTLSFLILFILSTFILKNPTISTVTVASFTASTTLTIVSLFWKMSGHMTYSTLLFFTTIFLFPNLSFLWLLFIFTPAIAWSRVELGKHTWIQTVAGVLVSTAISITFFFVL